MVGGDERGGRWRRAWAHRSVRVVAIVTALGLVVSGAGVGWLTLRYRRIHRTHFDRGTLVAGQRTAPQNFLVVGTDSRAFVEGAADAAAYGTDAEVGPPHADTILLVRTFPAQHRVVMLSFPRDLFVRIPGTPGEDRINAAVQGGPGRLVDTITENFGIAVNHYVEVDFRGFKGLVNAVGGVTLFFPAPVRDFDEEHQLSPTGLDIGQTGCVELDGDQALAYVRSRHYEQLVDGAWQPDPAGDLNRITRQQDFIRRTFGQALARGLLHPKRLNSLVGVAQRNVTLDDRLGLRDLRSLSAQLRSLAPEALQSYALPTSPGTTPAGAEVLFLDRAGADPIFDVFRGRTTAPPSLLPSAVRVRVLDGSKQEGRVKAAAFRLAAAGFLVDGIGTFDQAAKRTTIRFADGQQDKAALVAAHLAGPSELQPAGLLGGPDVVLIIGADWKGVLEAGPAPPTTTTTEPPIAEHHHHPAADNDHPARPRLLTNASIVE